MWWPRRYARISQETLMKISTNNLLSKITGWFSKKPQTKATWIMVFVSCVMMLTLYQNHRVIDDNAKALQTAFESLELQKVATSNAIHQIEIEEETRLNPELECAYDRDDKTFILWNVAMLRP
jgi:hypothetical protein